jgi:two-component system, OmpR family, heavy metal sensor histidine kinase CusS
MRRSPGRSLQVRLALGFALLITLLVGGSGLFLYSSIKSIVYGQLHREFTNAARLVAHKLDEDHLPLDKEVLDVGDHFLVRVMDPACRTLLESSGMEKKFPALCLPTPREPWVWSDGPVTAERSPRTLLIQFHDGWIQISRDLKPEENLLRRFFQSLLLVLLGAPILGGGLGFGLVKLGLRPLGDLEAAASNLRPENLKVRIDTSHLPSELIPLSVALNQSIARLEGAFRRLGELNSDLAHELRTPIHSLRLETEGILAQGGLTEATEEQLVGMMGTLDHMAALTEQMLFLARWEDPATQVEMSPLNVLGLLEAVREPFEPLADESQISIQVEAEAGLLLTGNSTLLRRALHNLLANAIRHSHDGGVVTLSAVQGPDGLALSVVDHGEGIPPQFLATLGQRFARTDLSRSRKRGGAGLGLAIVQGIARLHGATLHLQSQEGAGTVAQITFPRT